MRLAFESGPRWSVARWGLPAFALVFQLVTYEGYGFFRDELYYLANGRHLGLGYVDHPPLIGLIAAAIQTFLGESLFAVRTVPAFLGAAVVWISVDIARRLGGGRYAQLLAGIATLGAPLYLSQFGYLSLNSPDILIWAIVWLLMVRILRGENQRLWIAVGAVCGVGLLNKISVLFLGFGIVVGLVVCLRLVTFRSRWPWIGAAIAIALFLPHIGWQMANDWPTLEFIENARRNKMVPLAPIDFVTAQFTMMGPLALPVWMGGLLFLFLAPSRRAFRPLAWAFIAIVVLMIVEKGKAYYLGPAFTLLFASGGVAWECWSARFATKTIRATLLLCLILGSAISAPLATPILSVDEYVRYAERLGIAASSGEKKELGRLPQFFADMQGWRELAQTVAQVHATLPPDERRVAGIFAGNYGQAGAIDLFGPELGLPPAMSGHNSYYLWGPGKWNGDVLLVIGSTEEAIRKSFEEVEFGAVYTFPDCMPYENNKTIWIARRLKLPIDALWPGIKHYD